MGRQSSNKNKQSATDLLGFHFSTPAPSQLQQPQRHGHNENRSKHRPIQNSAQDRASARRKANAAMFYLHTSADHCFYLTRQTHSKLNPAKYSFAGSDNAVSWDSVRIVKQLMALSGNEKTDESPSCPICLCEFVCPRITKCGHVFCLSCLLHHVHSNTNPNHHVRCPCCSSPLLIQDLRAVIMETTISPTPQKSIHLVKLHREKTCSSPYIPVPGYSKHSHPACAPCMGDPDDRYCRFNYLNSAVYLSLLQNHQTELLQEVQSTPNTSLDHVFSTMALEIVAKDIQQAYQESGEEMSLQEDIIKPTSGFYQPQVPEPALPSAESLTPTESDDKGDDISQPTSSTSPKGACNRNRLQNISGSLYLDESTTFQLYQAADGQLVFLNGFNMTCLLSDFSRSRPDQSDAMSYPLPDSIDGKILEVERKNLTPELRKRLPFLSHLPLLADIVFVELDLNHILTDQTKQRFKAELAKRRKRRQSSVKAEKRADLVALKEETERINERRARSQRIDPDDDFFHQYVPEEPSWTAEDFAASVGGVMTEQTTIPAVHSVQGLNFSSAVRRDNGLVVSSTEAFPTLGSTVSVPATSSNTKAVGRWDTKPSSSVAGMPGKKGGSRKKGGKGKLLFSTGGQRGAG
jgi:hypothetical protein